MSGSAFDVAVIGGGFAGIACAVELAAQGRRVALIEKRPTLGGRVHSHRDAKTGDVIDNGPHMMVGAYRHTRALLRRLGTEPSVRFQRRLELIMQDEHGEIVYRRAGLPGDLGLAAGLVRMRGVSLRDVWRARRLLPEARRANRDGLDEMTCEQWFEQLGISPELRRLFLDPICASALNDAPAQASAALMANVLARAFTGRGNDAFGHILGPQVDLIGDRVEPLLRRSGGVVIAGRRALRVLLQGDTAGGVVLADGREIAARHVVVAVPHRHVAALFETPPLDHPHFAVLSELGAAPILNIHLWLDRPVTPRALLGLAGRPTQFLCNLDAIWPNPCGDRSRLVGIISGPTGSETLSNAALVEQMLGDMRALLPESANVRVLHSVVVKEREATFDPKPGLLRRRPGPTSPWPNVWWAGDWTATGLPATIESACESGVAAAKALLAQR